MVHDLHGLKNLEMRHPLGLLFVKVRVDCLIGAPFFDPRVTARLTRPLPGANLAPIETWLRWRRFLFLIRSSLVFRNLLSPQRLLINADLL